MMVEYSCAIVGGYIQNPRDVEHCGAAVTCMLAILSVQKPATIHTHREQLLSHFRILQPKLMGERRRSISNGLLSLEVRAKRD